MRTVHVLLVMISMVLAGCGGDGAEDCLLCEGMPSAKPDDNYAPTGEYKGVFVGSLGEGLQQSGSFVAHIEKAGGQYFGWSLLSSGGRSAENTQFSTEEIGEVITFILGNGKYELRISMGPKGGGSGEGLPGGNGNGEMPETGDSGDGSFDEWAENGDAEYELEDVTLNILGVPMDTMGDKETTFADCKCYEGTWEQSDDSDSQGYWNFLVCGEEVNGVYNGFASGDYSGVVQGGQVVLSEGSNPIAQGSLYGSFGSGMWSKFGYSGTWTGNQSCD